MAHRTKVLIVGPLPPEIGGGNLGGVAQHVWQLCKESLNHPIDFSLLATGKYFKATRTKYSIRIWGISVDFFILIKVLRLWFFHKRGIGSILTKPIRSMMFLVSLYRVFSISNSFVPDIIHIHGLYNEVIFALKLKWPNIPVVATIHSYNDFVYQNGNTKHSAPEWNKSIVEDRKKITSMLSKLIHVSKIDASKGVECELIDTNEVLVVPNGISFASIKNENDINHQRGNNILFVGAFKEIKRLELLIEALIEVNSQMKEPIHLTIVGGGENKSIVLTCEKYDWIDVKGYLQNSQLKELYQSHTVLIVPSLSESFGMVYFEALSLGCFVIGYDGVLNEFLEKIDNIDNRENAVIPFSPESTALDLKLKIVNIFKFNETIESRKVRVELANYVIKTMTWSTVLQDLIIIYNKVLSERKVNGFIN